ncbi:MAG: FG-GAP-like repeat-containing protein [bacterium]
MKNNHKLYIFCFLGLIGNMSLIAQAPPYLTERIIETDETDDFYESLDYHYTARDYVRLKPGTIIAPTTGSFTAKIDETLMFDMDYVETQPDADNRPLNTITAEVGITPGSFNVTSSGAATYSIPIYVPPGTAGMQPSLAVTYNSQAGNGLLGMGWNLSGISTITRVPSTIYHDGTVDGVDFDEDDRFALNGNRLIMITGSSYGEDGSVYGTETETFSKITAKNSVGVGPEHFIVETKDGKKLYYGSSTDSRYLPKNGTSVLNWYLKKVEDIHGNYMEYIYHNDQTEGEFWLSEIKYTGNGSEDPYNNIKFIYEFREDQELYYLEGTEILQKVLLVKIKCYAEEEKIKEYNFNYDKECNYSHMVEVIETGINDSELNSTILEYEETENLLISYNTYESSVFNRFVFGDYNGDGREDFITYEIKDNYDTTDKYEIYFAGSDGNNFTKHAQVNFESNFTGSVFTGDFNGDGNIDWVIKEVDGSDITYKVHTELSSSTSFTINYEHELFIVDYNGDGKHDFFVKRKYEHNNAWYWYIYDETGDLQRSGTIPSWGEEYIVDLNLQNRSLDFNGDGMSDIITFDANGLKVYRFPGSREVSMQEIANDSYPTHSEFVLLGDYNGDGKTDLISNESSTNIWKLHLSKGNGLYTNTLDELNDFHPNIENINTVHASDMNGDGKSDIIFIGRGNSTSNPQNRINIGYSKGNSFQLDETITGFEFNLYNEHLYNDVYGRESKFFRDFNGDGKSDIFYNYFNNGEICTITDNQTEQEKIFFLNYGKKEHLMRKILNGFNHLTEITYHSIANNSSIYIKQSDAAFPVKDIQAPIYVVTNVAASNGKGGQFNSSYVYKGGKFHNEGKGFLGFSEIIKSDPGIGITRSENEIIVSDNHVLMMPKKTTHKKPDETIISEVTYDNSVYDAWNDKRYFAFANIITKTNPLADHHTVETYTYDKPNGNITFQKTEYKEGTTLISKAETAYTDYTDAISTDNNSYLNKPGNIITVNTRGTETFSSEVEFFYNNDGTVYQKINNPGKIKSTTVTNSYYSSGYNNGMLQQSSLSTSLSGYSARHSYYEYDNKGRFLTKEWDELDNWSEYSYDNKWGKVLISNHSDGTSISYGYDRFGRLNTQVSNAGESKKITYEWDDLASPANSRFTVNSTTNNNENYVKEYFDVLGRSLRTESKNFDGMVVMTDNNYNSDGRKSSVSEPYSSGETPNITTYFYTDDGRVDFINYPTHEIDYSYTDADAEVTVTNTSVSPQQYSSKAYDAIGNIKTASDNGGTITYNYHPSGQISSVLTGGTTVAMTYDVYGMQETLDDPDAGMITFEYTPYGEIKKQTDAKANEYEMTYDELGRIKTKTSSDNITTTFEYHESGNGKGKIKKISDNGSVNNSIEYEYDNLSRLIKKTHNYSTKAFEYEFEYDTKNRLSRMKYPSGFWIKYEYNNYGYLYRVRRDDGSTTIIWEGVSTNERGQWTEYKFGNALVTKRTYDSYGFPIKIQTGTSSDENSIQDNYYEFEAKTGNLLYRKNLKLLEIDPEEYRFEEFSYDALNRLKKNMKKNDSYTLSTDLIDYEGSMGNTNGCITEKSDVGIYTYLPLTTPAHGINEVLLNQSWGQDVIDIDYTCFNKVEKIKKTESLPYTYYELEFDYDPYGNRRKTVYSNLGNPIETKYFVDNYEVIIDEATGTEKKLHYIHAGPSLVCVVEQTGTTKDLHYIHTDYLGSIEYITDQSGSVEQKMSYDPWGRLRDYDTWSYSSAPEPMFDRGFTTHEHLTEFNLINMNGRVYDPVLGVFLSPDPYVQMPDYTQNYNRYAYALNNPLIYTDPSGERFRLLNLIPVYGPIAWLTGTEEGYEFQKDISPIAVHVDLHLSNQQKGVGLDVSLGMPKMAPISYRTHGGATYYWGHYDNSYTGWETRHGGEWTFAHFLNYSGTTFNSGGTSQTTNMITIGGPFMNFKYENDYMFGLGEKIPFVPAADGGDRYRTAAARLKIGRFKAGVNLFTGDPGLNADLRPRFFDENNNMRETYLETADAHPDQYRAGIFYIGFGSFKIGRNSEKNRNIFQNKFAHDFMMGGESPYFLVLDRKPMWYFYFGTGTGNTLW